MITSGQSVPNLVVSRRVVAKMSAAARRFIADETGEAMVGLLVPSPQPGGVATLYVLDTISPADSDTHDAPVRQWGMFEQGDDWQGEVFSWLYENWEAQREQHHVPAKWDVPLIHPGDWHKQPGYMIKPSYGDLITALTMLDDEDRQFKFLLVPIVTLGHPATTTSDGMSVNYLTASMHDGTDLRVDFWYIHDDMRMFQPIIPAIYPEDQLPTLAPYPWNLTNEDRYNAEISQLRGDGLFTSVIWWQAEAELPLNICFLAARSGTGKVLILTTRWDYPKSAPHARLAPFVQMNDNEELYDVFEQLWGQSTPVQDPPGWQWNEQHYLVDYVHALEKSLNLAPESATKPGEGEKS